MVNVANSFQEVCKDVLFFHEGNRATVMSGAADHTAVKQSRQPEIVRLSGNLFQQGNSLAMQVSLVASFYSRQLFLQRVTAEVAERSATKEHQISLSNAVAC